MKNNKTIENVTDCCGCGLCVNICPVSAIKMKKNQEGFMVPEILGECINCGKCLKNCIVANPMIGHRYLFAYAGFSKDSLVRKNSSSGGIFPELAKHFLCSGGSVWGAAYESGMEVKHLEIYDEKELDRLIGSKYVQSYISDSFKHIKKRVQLGKKVMFVGTPCQVGALKTFVGDNENFITVDLVCHGVPAPGLYMDYIKFLEKKYNKKICNYIFREKDSEEKAGMSYTTKIEFKTNKNKERNIIIDGNEDPYIMNFLGNALQRESCFSCPYTKMERVGDITLADYWGYEEFYPEWNREKGVSLILVNTEKGKKVLGEIKEKLKLIPAKEEEFMVRNHHLYQTPKKSNRRDALYTEYAEQGFSRKFYRSVFLPKAYNMYILKRKILKLVGKIK